MPVPPAEKVDDALGSYIAYTYIYTYFFEGKNASIVTFKMRTSPKFSIFLGISILHIERKSNIKDFWFTIFMQKVCC